MPASPLSRVVCLLLLAACSAPPPAPPPKPPADYPNAAALWRLQRYLDERDNIPPRAWQTALNQRAANVAAVAAIPDAGGISPLAWTQRGPDNVAGRSRSIAIDPTNPQRIWVGAVSGGLWKSDNGGASWTQVDDWWSNLSCGCVVIDPHDANVMYVGTGEGHYSLAHLARSVSHFVRGAGVMKSIDRGATWTQLANTAAWQHTTRIAVSPANPNILLASRRPGGVARSTDGGLTWTDVTGGLVTDPFSYQVLFDPNDATKAVAHLAPGSVATHHLIRSTDGGLTWQLAASGLASISGEFSRIELAYARTTPGMVYASCGASGGKVWRSTDGGANWTQRTQPGNDLGTSYYYNGLWVDPTDSNHLVVSAQFIWRSTDGGTTFTQISSGYIMTVEPHADAHAFANDPGYNGTTNRRLYVATDGGLHVAPDIAAAAQGVGWQDLDTTMRSTQFYAAAAHLTGGVVIGGTQDNGTLRVVGGNPNANLVFGGDGGQVQIDPTNPQYTYGEYQFLGVHRSSNGGASAVQITSGLLDVGAGLSNFVSPLRLDPNDGNRLYAGGRSLWRTTSARGAATWTSIKPDAGSLIARSRSRPASRTACSSGTTTAGSTARTTRRRWRRSGPRSTTTRGGSAAEPRADAARDRSDQHRDRLRVLRRLRGRQRLALARRGHDVAGRSGHGFVRAAGCARVWPRGAPGRRQRALCGDGGRRVRERRLRRALVGEQRRARERRLRGGCVRARARDRASSCSRRWAEACGPRRSCGRRRRVRQRVRGPRVAAVARGRSAAPARLGQTMTFVGSNIASASPFAMLLLGVSNANWLGVPLPLCTRRARHDGCALQTSLELTPVAAVSAAQRRGTSRCRPTRSSSVRRCSAKCSPRSRA
jgi:hypothetical protein